MPMTIRRALTLVLIAISLPAAAGSFPASVTVEDAVFSKVAQARYSLLWKTITEVALYVDPAQSAPEGGDILSPDYSKYLTIEYGVGVSAERFEKMSRDLLKENWPAEILAANSSAIDRFCSWLQSVEKGDRYAVYWTPQSGLSLALNGELKGSLASVEGAAIVLSLWLGRASVSEAQRDEILSDWRASFD